jgi:NOL1/NOP2/sun family putative RNA methylase
MAIQIHPCLSQLLDGLLGIESREVFARAGTPNPVRFRFNGLKHHRAFQERLLEIEGFRLHPMTAFPEARSLVGHDTPIGKSLTHFLGEIYIQDPASMLPALILGPEPRDRVLDLCAAPGSKTTQLASIMGNRGTLVANDSSGRRLRSLVFNLRRMGVINTIVVRGYGEQYGNRYFEHFDAVLLDAPCSAVGTLHKSPEVLTWWTPERSRRLAVRQRDLLFSGLKALRPGGRLVYSTCTLVPDENEAVVEGALRDLPVELEEIGPVGLETRPGLTRFGSRRFDPRLRKAIRVYPHHGDTEGFFIARFRKTASFGESRVRRPPESLSTQGTVERGSADEFAARLAARYGWPDDVPADWLFVSGSGLHCGAAELREFPLWDKPVSLGLPIAHLKKPPVRLTTEGSHLLGGFARRNVHRLTDAEDLFRFVNRDTLSAEKTENGQVLVAFEGEVLGHALADGGKLLSRFPRVGWTFGPATDEK